MENVSQEVMTSVLPCLIKSPNQQHEHGELRECFVLNHRASSPDELNQIRRLGLIIGFGMRSQQAWNINLHPIIWKQIVGAPLDPDEDLKSFDLYTYQNLDAFRKYAEYSTNEEEFQAQTFGQCFTVDYGNGEVELIPGGASKLVTRENLPEYLKLASLAVLKKASLQLQYLLTGVYYVIAKSTC